MTNNELLYKPKNAYEAKDVDFEKADRFCKGYREFIDLAKTEREASAYAAERAKENGFTEFDRKKTYKPGDKVYYVNRKKSIMLAVIGSSDIELGADIIVSHVDSPRLDIKQHPLYEDSSLAYFKTHYYGGLK